MVTIRQGDSRDVEDVLHLIGQQQRDPARACSYLGTEPAGIRAELNEVSADWWRRLLVAEADGDLVGVALPDWDASLGRSWLHGPWVVGDWLPVARELLPAALASLPTGVTRHELSADTAHTAMAALAAELGWTASEVNHVYVADRTTIDRWPVDDPRVRRPDPGDLPALRALHDAEFPDTYASADQLLSRAVDDSWLVAVAYHVSCRRGEFLGYGAGRVQPDGEGYLDFLAVTEAARGEGVGAALLVTLGRRIAMTAPNGTINLTVQEHRRAACALYERFGLRRECSMVAYRSWR